MRVGNGCTGADKIVRVRDSVSANNDATASVAADPSSPIIHRTQVLRLSEAGHDLDAAADLIANSRHAAGLVEADPPTPIIGRTQVIQFSEAGHHWAAAAVLIANARYVRRQCCNKELDDRLTDVEETTAHAAPASVATESSSEQLILSSTPVIHVDQVRQLSKAGHHWAAAAVLIANVRYSALRKRNSLVCSNSPHSKRQRNC